MVKRGAKSVRAVIWCFRKEKDMHKSELGASVCSHRIPYTPMQSSMTEKWNRKSRGSGTYFKVVS